MKIIWNTYGPQLLFCASLIFTLEANAQSAEEPNPDVYASLTLESVIDDNATQREDDEDKIREQQNRLSLDFGWAYTMGPNILRGDYIYSAEEFTRDSQRRESNFVGASALHLEAFSNVMGIDLAHDRRLVLGDPSASITSSNTQELETVNASPYIQTRETAAGAFKLTGLYAQTRYPELDFGDSETVGAEGQWLRSLSPIRRVGARARGARSSFSDFPERDYDYQRASLFLNTALRLWSYEIEVGSDRIETSAAGEQSDSAFYRVSANYLLGQSNFSLSSYQQQTDSNNVNSNVSALGNISVGANISDQNDFDIVDSRSTRVGLSRPVCRRCDVAVSVVFNEIDYKTIKINNVDTVFGTASLDYRLPSSITVRSSLSYRNSDFPNDAAQNATSHIFRVLLQRNASEHLEYGLEYQREMQDTARANSVANVFGAFVRLSQE